MKRQQQPSWMMTLTVRLHCPSCNHEFAKVYKKTSATDLASEPEATAEPSASTSSCGPGPGTNKDLCDSDIETRSLDASWAREDKQKRKRRRKNKDGKTEQTLEPEVDAVAPAPEAHEVSSQADEEVLTQTVPEEFLPAPPKAPHVPSPAEIESPFAETLAA